MNLVYLYHHYCHGKLYLSRLQILSDRIVDKFVSSGLMHRDYDRVKLHVTVMNTMFRKDPSGTADAAPTRGGPRSGMKERESFDASNVLRVSIVLSMFSS